MGHGRRAARPRAHDVDHLPAMRRRAERGRGPAPLQGPLLVSSFVSLDRRAASGSADAMRGHVTEERQDHDDPLPAGHAAAPGVPEDHVEERGQRQEDDPQDRPDDRAKRPVDPGREDPREREREPWREERDQYDEAAQRGVLPSRPAKIDRLVRSI